MSKRMSWLNAGFVVLLSAATAGAAHTPGKDEGTKTGMKGLTIGGSVEAGYFNSWIPSGNRDSVMGVDQLTMKTTFDVTDKTKVQVDNLFLALTNGASVSTSAVNFLSGSYFPTRTLLSAGSFAYANQNLYLDHAFGDGFHLSVGHFRNPFGMEGLWDRYDMHSYLYSGAYNRAHGLGWDYDVGLKFTFTDLIPGSVELAVVDGRDSVTTGGSAGSPGSTPGVSARWWTEFGKNSDFTVTPVVSVLAEQWRGGPADLGITAGAMLKGGAWFLNAEWVYVGRKAVAGGSYAGQWDIHGEPGFDLGVIQVAAKIDYQKSMGGATNVSDWNVGGAISHTYNDKFRIRAVYQHQNLSGNFGAHVNNVALLLGTKW